MHHFSRRDFLAASVSGSLLVHSTLAQGADEPTSAEPIIDIHQHTTYRERTSAQLMAHQQTMGVTQTILLPAGSSPDSTRKSFCSVRTK